MTKKSQDKQLTEVSTQEKKRVEKRAAIIDGAVRVFAERGFFNTTVSQVAKAAGVADGTIYLYFKSKDELLLSVFDEKMALLCESAEKKIVQTTSASQAMKEICALHLQAVEKNPAVASVLIVELRQTSAFVKKAEKPMLSAYLKIIAGIVKQGQEQGEFRADIEPAAVKRALFGALDELALGWLMAKTKFDLYKTGQDIAHIFVQGLSAIPVVLQEQDRTVKENRSVVSPSQSNTHAAPSKNRRAEAKAS